MTTITIVYAADDRVLAERLAGDFEANGFTFGDVAAADVVVGVVSRDGLTDPSLNETLTAALDSGRHIVLATDGEVTLPTLFDHLQTVTFTNKDYRFNTLKTAVEALAASDAPPLKVQTPNVQARNRRAGIVAGVGLFALFLAYTFLIARFDIEAPQEDFDRANTRIAATVNMIAQPFIPRSTEEAEAFPQTLEARNVSDELATVLAATATQVGIDGGAFTPIPTGLIVVTEPISEVRMTATGGAIIRATQTAAVSDEEFERIAATATQAAIDAENTD